ncbi:MAG TPA: serine/threonine-protein kinase, partial [Candidatus Synoicihabitans sp.]|nr:serine/threonine-protein kinase [Candidatus Synoicihabitans sp.]
MPLAERARLLDQACIENPDLASRRQEITNLLTVNGHSAEEPGAQNNPRSFEGARRIFDCALEINDAETESMRIGPYKLMQKIGEGGFGVVWMAEQQEPIRRRVALKIIKSGMDTKEVIARFGAERQALALMEHPNIARVFDAGATATGRPYFVMELVRGVAITRYCDNHQLTPEARLGLFIAVCQAVQHAHQKGIVHRDLKPSNILVTLNDAVPVPKIIDFGIAKATGIQLTDTTVFTQFHAFLGTPAYTSPEQMEMSGLDMDTRSDIYSLGVLLYELLTGRPPFDPEALAKSGLEAMRRTIREVDPPRPSYRLSTLPDADRATVAHQRGTDSSRLSLLLRGDLDWIVMRCLEKDRTRRYDTASALAMDVQRHLASEPVAARPPSSFYRVRKFVRRHRIGVALASSATILLLAGLFVSSLLLMRERAAHARALAAEHQEGVLRREAEDARAAEATRASRTARELAEQFFTEGRTAEGLAYLVHAARKDPGNPTLGPRLASAITLHNYLIPVQSPLRLPADVTHVDYLQDGRRIVAYAQDGTIGFIDAATGGVVRTKLPAPLAGDGVLLTGRATVILGEDGVIRVLDSTTGEITREFTFEKPIVGIAARNPDHPIFVVSFEDHTSIVADTITGRFRVLPFALSATLQCSVSADGRWLTRSENPH